MQKLSYTITDYSDLPNSKLAYFEGDFDGAAKDSIIELQKAVSSCSTGCTMIFDFSKLNYLNSFAIGQLVDWHNTLNTKAGKVVIVGANKNVEDVFTVLGLASILKIYSTLEEAKADLSSF